MQVNFLGIFRLLYSSWQRATQPSYPPPVSARRDHLPATRIPATAEAD